MRKRYLPRHFAGWLIAAAAGMGLAGATGAQAPPPQLSLCVPQDLPCFASSECCSGLVCNVVCLPSTPTCQGEGEVCTSSSQCCGSGVCYNFFCRTPVGAGDACGPAVPCGSGLVCAFPQYVCRHQPPELGEPCSAIVPCASGLACTTLTTFVCVHSPAQEGEHCDVAAPCGDGLFCQAGTQLCKRFKTIGDGCSVVNPCMPGLVCQPCFVTGCNAPFQCFPDVNQGPLNDAQCRTFYSAALAQAAMETHVTMTYGGGTGVAGGVAASTEIGAAYGEDGRFGCYLTDCGGIDTNAAVSAFVSVGFYDTFDDLPGAAFAVVETAGVDPVAYSTSQIFPYVGGPLIGTEDQLSVGASVSPVDAGVYQCHTILSTVISPAPPSVCTGDCQGVGMVTVDDLLTLVNIVLGNAQPSACANGIPSGSQPSVASILQAVENALNGCPAS